MKNSLLVIGAGLSGAEAAWQAAQRGIPTELAEMRPHKKSPAHHTDFFAELQRLLRFPGNHLCQCQLRSCPRHSGTP